MTTQITTQRRTYTRSIPQTPASVRRDQHIACALARQSAPGWEHYAGDICYVREVGGIIRIAHGPDGQHLSERRLG